MEYLSDHGLIGTHPEAMRALIDDVLDPDEVSAEERCELLADHELLAATAQLRLMCAFMEPDEDGVDRLAFKHGEYAYYIYDGEEFLEFLREEPKHLAALTALVCDVLFERFVEDARAAARREAA